MFTRSNRGQIGLIGLALVLLILAALAYFQLKPANEGAASNTIAPAKAIETFKQQKELIDQTINLRQELPSPAE